MDFESIRNRWSWTEYAGQTTTGVTYVYVSPDAVARLRGESDILYVGQTAQSICKRYKQETTTSNTDGNTQGTNIRLTRIFSQIDLSNIRCYFTRQMTSEFIRSDPFVEELRFWDKRHYLRSIKMHPISVSFEKHLLVEYAVAHLELPPLNNRV